LAKHANYVGVGTIEYLYDPQSEEFAFLEMNTRLQVEHTVTEAITGIDLVREQIRVARGESLDLEQDDISFTGHAIELRVNAEDPENNFFPSPGLIQSMTLSQRNEVRNDFGYGSGDLVTP